LINQIAVHKAEPKHGIVIFDTRFGNTEKIARWFESGLQEADIETLCTNARAVNLESLGEFDLICVGGPTEWHTSSKPMKDLLKTLETVDVSGKYGFAFDTKLNGLFSGSAAKFIEKQLKHLGLKIIAPRESATVFLEDGRLGDALLRKGEEKRFEKIGRQVGTNLVARSEVALV